MKPKLLLIFLLIAFVSKAQDKIDTDRPDQTESAVTVPKKWFQAEFGMHKENYGERNFRIVHPTFLFKYGISKKVELRLEGAFASDYEHLIPNTKTTTGLEPLEIGTKIALFEEKGLVPKTSLIFHLGLPFTGTGEQGGRNPFPALRLSFQHTITDNIGLGYNFGAEGEGYGDDSPVWIYTFSPNFNIGEKWYAYVEIFGNGYLGYWQHALDAGLAYFVSNNVKVDLSGGVGLGNNILKNYVAAGFSFRLPTGGKK